METCSNCGATNRPGAKFCTSCGVRLPALSPQTTADWDRPASGSTSAAAATTTPEPETVSDSAASTSPIAADETARDAAADEPEAATTSWSEPATTADNETVAATSSDTDTAPASEERSTWSWGQTETSPHDDTGASIDADAPQPDTTATDTEPAADSEPTADTPEAEGDDTAASTGGPEGDASSTLSNWASQWTGEYAAAPEAGDEQRADAEDAPGTQQSEEDAASAPSDELEPALSAATTGAATAQSGLASTSGTGVEPPADEGDQASASAPPTADDQAGAMQRAGDLLDELRGLLPMLAAAPAAAPETAAPEMDDDTTPATDTSGIADDLAAARADANDTTDLRRTLEGARNRQRDVDTMIDIVGRIDPMLAALDAHDRYAAAIDHAITRLRGTSGDTASNTSDTPAQDDDGSFSWQS